MVRILYRELWQSIFPSYWSHGILLVAVLAGLVWLGWGSAHAYGLVGKRWNTQHRGTLGNLKHDVFWGSGTGGKGDQHNMGVSSNLRHGDFWGSALSCELGKGDQLNTLAGNWAGLSRLEWVWADFLGLVHLGFGDSWINIFTTSYIGGKIKSSPGLNNKGWIKFNSQLHPDSFAQTLLAVFFLTSLLSY